MRVMDIMRTDTTFVSSDASLREAAETMSAEQVGFLAVRDGGQIVGVVTDRDIALRPARRSQRYDSARVADVMSPRAHAVRSSTPVTGAAIAMKQKGVRRLLVLDEGTQVVGVISLSDIAAHSSMPELAGAVYRHLASDEPDAVPAPERT